MLLLRMRRNLTTKLALLVVLAVSLVMLALGVYFDIFLRQNFLEITSQRMQHAYQRLGYNLAQIEAGLREGASFAKTDERLVASVELINRYQDKTRYNTFLIDEEKKTLAVELLDRVKLSMNTEIALYDARGELIAYASQGRDGYQLGYVSFDGGKLHVLNRHERYADFQPGKLPELGTVHSDHIVFYPNEAIQQGGNVVYQRLGDTLVISNHQNVFESRSGRVIAHLEIVRKLDAGYFAQLSKEMDIGIGHAFQSEFAAQAGLLDNKDALAALSIAPLGDHYVGVMKRDILNGPVYFQVEVDRAQHNAVVNTHRYRFMMLMVLVAALILLLMRFVIQRSLAQPLGKLMEQIRSIERGDYVLLPPVETGDELQEISHSVNTLAAAVGEREGSLERARNEQEFLSNHDSLTGLPNRRFFAHRLEHALDLARRNHTELAVFFLDLDQFKLVNDTLGHGVGDELLVQIGARLRNSFRSSDTLARIGGDEFNVLIENVQSIGEVEAIVAKYLSLFCEPFACGSHEISTTVSIGVALYPKDGEDSVSLLKHADLAVYKAKDSGRDRYSFFSEDLARRANQRAETIHALNAALEAGDQFTLYYQPKVNAASGKVVSAEALIRWNCPGFGMVPPLDFIPLAEETGHILAIGEWVIHRGCKDLVAMRDAGINLAHLSMNVSNVQMRGHELDKILQRAIADNGLRAEQIELEITESYVAHDLAQAIVTLNSYRAMGLQLAIDDFGTGYSSMSYLQKLPFTRMKIDKSFIDGLPHDHDSVSITRAILGLAKNFGLAVTAEGVERIEQLQFLQQEGCDEIQGYYFAKPMPLDSFMAFCNGKQ
jgi:diguanylate cyclase (GGDEF)-like protein